MKRVFLIVLDSVGVGELPDAADYQDEGSNTLLAASQSPYFNMPNMEKLGLFAIDGVEVAENKKHGVTPTGIYGKMMEASRGKDTTIGHWEIAGVISKEPLPTFPNGFPKDLIEAFEVATGRKVICNQPYSGTEVIKDYGKEHMETGALIVYTSADSVFQIAAHEDVVPIEQLYEYCEIARRLCTGKYGVGRVIARPFEGTEGNFIRTARRHDYSLQPPERTMLDTLKDNGLDVIAVGKIGDIFAGKGITEGVRTVNNAEGIERTLEYTKKDFHGLCFVNLVDFDMKYGHRNDVEGYAKALTYFDNRLPEIMDNLKEEDVLIITADHGCDPSTPSTDHSREYTPLVIYGKQLKKNVNLHVKKTFSDIAATVVDYFQLPVETKGTSFLKEII